MPGPQNGRYAAEPLVGLTSLKDIDKRAARDTTPRRSWRWTLGDTIKRIDGTEVPL